MANELEKTVENTNETEETKTVDAAQLEARIKQLESENNKLRQANTNASADASKWKKQYQDKLSEEERTKEQQSEAAASMQKELETLRAERNVANYKSQLTAPGIGFDADLAQEMAEALNTGDTAKVFDGLRKFLVAHDKTLTEQNLRNNPTLPGGATPKTISQAEFHAMSLSERMKLFDEQPDLYNELMRKE